MQHAIDQHNQPAWRWTPIVRADDPRFLQVGGRGYAALRRASKLLDEADQDVQVMERLAHLAARTVGDIAVVLVCDAAGNISSVTATTAFDGDVRAYGGTAPGPLPGELAALCAPDSVPRDSRSAAVRVLQVMGPVLLAPSDADAAVESFHATASPLVFRGRVLGVLIVARRPSRPEFRAADIQFLEVLADRAAAAAEHARLQLFHQNARRRAELAEVRSRQLQRATAALATAATPEQVAEVAVRQAVAALDAVGGRLRRYGDAHGAVTERVLFEHGGWDRLEMSADRTPVRPRAAVSGEVTEPLVLGDSPLGAIELTFPDDRVLDDDERSLIVALARETSAALARVEFAAAEHAARTAAERANQAKGDFLAIMSHELRTPLSAIIGYASLLADGISGDVTEDQLQQLSRIGASARHLLAMIEDVLTYTQLEARTATPVLRRVDIADIVREAATMIEPIILPQGLTLDVQLPHETLDAESDARHVRQILLNLLSNAVKFTPSGGRVSMRAEERNGDIELTVADTGIGIAPEHHAMIFEPFHQVDQRYSRRVGGVGVGLSIVRDLARGLGGQVTVDSTVGQGTSFIVRLPRRLTGTTPTDANFRAFPEPP